jgi:large subunit ribosomal protein L10
MNQRSIKNHKLEAVDVFCNYFNNNKGIAIFENKGIQVSEINEVRKKARQHNIKIEVAKNSLIEIAFKKTIHTELVKNLHLKGTLMALIADNAIDAVGFTQSLSKTEKKLLSPILIADKMGIISDTRQVANLAKMKNLQGLTASFVMALKMPTIRLVKILDIIKEQKK